MNLQLLIPGDLRDNFSQLHIPKGLRPSAMGQTTSLQNWPEVRKRGPIYLTSSPVVAAKENSPSEAEPVALFARFFVCDLSGGPLRGSPAKQRKQATKAKSSRRSARPRLVVNIPSNGGSVSER